MSKFHQISLLIKIKISYMKTIIIWMIMESKQKIKIKIRMFKQTRMQYHNKDKTFKMLHKNKFRLTHLKIKPTNKLMQKIIKFHRIMIKFKKTTISNHKTNLCNKILVQNKKYKTIWLKFTVKK